jgi:hypothetical protein
LTVDESLVAVGDNLQENARQRVKNQVGEYSRSFLAQLLRAINSKKIFTEEVNWNTNDCEQGYSNPDRLLKQESKAFLLTLTVGLRSVDTECFSETKVEGVDQDLQNTVVILCSAFESRELSTGNQEF